MDITARLAFVSLCLPLVHAAGQTVDPAFATSYSLTPLGSVPGVPTNYGGLALLPADPTP